MSFTMIPTPSHSFPLDPERSQCLALCPAPLPKASAEGSVITSSSCSLIPSHLAPNLSTPLCPSTTTSALLNLGGTSLHWFPLADKAVEPTSSPPSTSSPVYPIRKWRPSQPRSSSLSFSPPSHETVLYHPSTRECIFIPPHLHSPHQFQEILKHLEQPRDEYSPLSFSGPLLTTYQFLVAWTKFLPRECPPSYFLLDEDLGGWYMDRRLMVAIQLALEKLQAVIRDILALVGDNGPDFQIDHGLELSEKLWRAKDLKELRTADKLLKLRVQLAFVRLEKLERLHKGLSWASPLVPKSSFFLPLELCGSLQVAWKAPSQEPSPRSRLCPLRLVQGGKQLGTTPSGGIPKPPGPARRLPGPPIPSAGLPLPNLQPLCARIPPPIINIIQESTQLQDLGGQPSPSPPRPRSFGNLTILPRHHSPQNTLNRGSPMTPSTSGLDEYCRPSGHALPIPFHHGPSHSPSWKWPLIAPGAHPEWAPASYSMIAKRTVA
ncbi:hypothetical protein BS47DRAFT_1402606 [Hydnum rufescens UP504]|uniref:Uncharacterized protein n=1 Tax=Hydnum rufescens UP504 TaxID=1448309 RepID=A0A9P6ACL2_9AGAM|nr:hypothetical protein BS47DRAFT_1402606 [Hydnum rufescens UP504]